MAEDLDQEQETEPEESQESVLTTKARNQLPDSAFVFPKTKSYPIHDLAHARNALARVSAYGTPAEKAAVRAAVYKRYPELRKSTNNSLALMLSESVEV